MIQKQNYFSFPDSKGSQSKMALYKDQIQGILCKTWSQGSHKRVGLRLLLKPQKD